MRAPFPIRPSSAGSSIRLAAACRAALFALLLGWTASPQARAEDAPDLDDLSFLSGAWGVDGTVVEYWLPPLRGLMVGVNRAPEGTDTPFFEFLLIEQRADGIYYVASPRGTGTTAFRLTQVSDGYAVFENPEHDFPQKIVYRRDGDTLEAEVGATRNGEWSSFTLSWKAIASTHADSTERADSR